MNQRTVYHRGLAFLVLVIALFSPSFIAAQDIPSPIPHPLEGREACLACHETGVAGATQIPADHTGRTNEICTGCHQLALSEPPPDAEAGPLSVPHTLEGRTDCLDCHVSSESTEIPDGGPAAIPHPLIGRQNCLACHQEGIGGAAQVPADHAGRTNEVCQACHEPGQIPAAPTPIPATEAIPTPIVYPRAEGVDTCVDCHLTLEEKHVDVVTEWQRSIHSDREVSCADCHGGNPGATDVNESMSPAAGYIGVPAKTDIPALCASCHSDVSLMRQYDLPTDQYDKYNESIHGVRLAEGDLNVTTCFDCHGGHEILKANDPASTVYPTKVPELCANCHSNETLMAPYDIPTNQFSLYRQSVHGHALIDNQDFRAPNCATCHGTHGAAPPGFQEVANVCGSCHSATQDHYLKSAHAKLGDNGPKCVTCHGRYDVGKPSEALYLGPEPRHCGSCHTPDSTPGQVAQSMYDAITISSRAYEEAEAGVEAARRLGMLVGAEENQLREANTDIVTARAAQHTLDISAVNELTESAREVAEQARANAEAAVAESIFRRRAMVVAVAAIGLAIVPLVMLKRAFDRRQDVDS